jgi:hypothetical protein
MDSSHDASIPSSIKKSYIFIILGLLIGLVDLVFQNLGVTSQDSTLGSYINFIVGVLITFFLMFFIYKKQNWARVIYVILVVLGLIPIVSIFMIELDKDYIGAASTLFQSLCQVISAVLLYLKGSSEWFRSK